MVEPDYIISPSDVRKVLESTLRGDLVRDIEPLDSLFVVEQHLIERDLPFRPVYRRLVLVDLLCSEISVEYKRQRLSANRQPPSDNLPSEIISQLIFEDLDSSGNPAILGWLWLYLKYVTRIPELRPSVFAQNAYVDHRTLRRYQNLALRQLTARLVRLEIEARTNRRQARLKAQLPRLGRATCIGRDKEIRWITDLFTSDRYRPVVIVGQPGVGKSTLAESIASHLIEKGVLDSVIWLENTHSVPAIEAHLRERFLEDYSTTTIQEFLFLRRVFIVLDNVNPDDTVRFAAEIQRLYGARLIITCSSILKLADSQTLRLEGITLEASVRLLDYLDFRKEIPKSSLVHVAAKLHQLTNGNPLQLEEQYRQYILFQTLTPINEGQSDWCRTVYEQISPDSRFAWAVLSIGPMCYRDMVDGQLPGIDAPALGELRDKLIIADNIDIDSLSSLLNPTSREFMHNVYRQDNSMQSALQSWIVEVASSERFTDCLVNLMEQVLQADWIGMEDEWRSRCIQRIWWYGVREGRWTLWAALLEIELTKHSILSETSMVLTTAYAMCLRRLGQVSKAAELLESVLQLAQRLAPSRITVLIHLELAAVSRGKGDYSLSEDFLVIASNSPHTESLPEDSVEWLRAEQARMYIDRGLFSEAALLLKQTTSTIQVKLLYAELAVRQNRCEVGENAIFDLLTTPKVKPSIMGRAYTLLGMSRQVQGDIYNAKRFFAIAEATLETNTDDPYGIARAKSNLGAVLIEWGKYREATQLLQEAARIQKAIQDRVGLATTMHNQSILRRKH